MTGVQLLTKKIILKACHHGGTYVSIMMPFHLMLKHFISGEGKEAVNTPVVILCLLHLV